jgi:hypothetical protein
MITVWQGGDDGRSSAAGDDIADLDDAEEDGELEA